MRIMSNTNFVIKFNIKLSNDIDVKLANNVQYQLCHQIIE